MKKHKILIATPAFGGQVTIAFASSVLKLTNAHRQDVTFEVQMLGNESLITRARNNFTSVFLDDESFTHMLFVDADVGFEPEEVYRLLDSGHEVCSGAYPMKFIDYPVLHEKAKTVDPMWLEQACHRYPVFFEGGGEVEVINGFAKAMFLPTGFMLIARSAVTKLKSAFPEKKYHSSTTENAYTFFDCGIHEDTREYLSEDFHFCKLYKQTGNDATLWLDIRSRLSHSGYHTFNGDIRTRFLPKP